MNYIHVVSLTKVPENRGTSGTPFEDWENDPNVSGFGPTERTMFLPVEEPEAPTVDPMLERVTATYTPDIDGKNVRGVYVAGDEVWRFTWAVLPQELETARQIKRDELLTARGVEEAAGYPVGQLVFPLTWEFYNELHTTHDWWQLAISNGFTEEGGQPIDGTETQYFEDIMGRKVTVNFTQLKTHYLEFGLEFQKHNRRVAASSQALLDATTLEQIAAVKFTITGA